jgi:hypothetical protein
VANQVNSRTERWNYEIHQVSTVQGKLATLPAIWEIQESQEGQRVGVNMVSLLQEKQLSFIYTYRYALNI